MGWASISEASGERASLGLAGVIVRQHPAVLLDNIIIFPSRHDRSREIFHKQRKLVSNLTRTRRTQITAEQLMTNLQSTGAGILQPTLTLHS